MQRFIDWLIQVLNWLRSLLGGKPATGEERPCLLGMHELPPNPPLPALPQIHHSADVKRFFPSSTALRAPAAACHATVRPELGTVYLRTGPRFDFVPLAETRGGLRFEIVGASEPDADDIRWFQLRLGEQSGWLRADLLRLEPDCAGLGFIRPEDLTPAAPPAPPNGERFPLPFTAPISQTYSSAHRGLDLASTFGTALRASTNAIIIRAMTCTNCTDARPNVYPCGTSVLSNPDWGYGYGNFVVLRHDYAALPEALRAEMDRLRYSGGFAYLLYAHLSRLDLHLGQHVQAGDLIGLTGHHGCSTGPHLHLELRIGRDEMIDGFWMNQAPVNPNRFFIV